MYRALHVARAEHESGDFNSGLSAVVRFLPVRLQLIVIVTERQQQEIGLRVLNLSCHFAVRS